MTPLEAAVRGTRRSCLAELSADALEPVGNGPGGDVVGDPGGLPLEIAHDIEAIGHALRPSTCREQAFSPDAGGTWEANWAMSPVRSA